jgi:hypothetical protein
VQQIALAALVGAQTCYIALRRYYAGQVEQLKRDLARERRRH